MGQARFIIKLLCAALFIVLYGCGGGSSGTDGGVSIRLTGTVSNGSGAPQSGLSVTLLESGDTGTTDQNGVYTLPTQLEGSVATLLVSDGQKESRAIIRELNVVQGDEVSIDLVLSESEFTVSVVSVSINEPISPDPTPTPRPQETPVPQSVIVEGTLKLPDGRAVRGFKVSIVGDRSSDVTDRNGAFSLRTTRRDISLAIENTRDKAVVKLPAISSSTRRISVELAVLVALPSGNDIGTLALLPFEATLAKKPKLSR